MSTGVYPFVCPSIRPCIVSNRLKISSDFFPGLVALSVYVFEADRCYSRNLLSGGIKYTGWGKWRFLTEIAVLLGKRIRDRPTVDMER